MGNGVVKEQDAEYDAETHDESSQEAKEDEIVPAAIMGGGCAYGGSQSVE